MMSPQQLSAIFDEDSFDESVVVVKPAMGGRDAKVIESYNMEDFEEKYELVEQVFEDFRDEMDFLLPFVVITDKMLYAIQKENL